MWWKISVTKFRKSKIWVDSFVAFSIGFLVVYSIFSGDTVFMVKSAKQNGHFSTFWKKLKKTKFEQQISPPENCLGFFPMSPSWLPIREDHFGPLNFYLGWFLGIFIQDLLCSDNDKKWPILWEKKWPIFRCDPFSEITSNCTKMSSIVKPFKPN